MNKNYKKSAKTNSESAGKIPVEKTTNNNQNPSTMERKMTPREKKMALRAKNGVINSVLDGLKTEKKFSEPVLKVVSKMLDKAITFNVKEKFLSHESTGSLTTELINALGINTYNPVNVNLDEQVYSNKERMDALRLALREGLTAENVKQLPKYFHSWRFVMGTYVYVFFKNETSMEKVSEQLFLSNSFQDSINRCSNKVLNRPKDKPNQINVETVELVGTKDENYVGFIVSDSRLIPSIN